MMGETKPCRSRKTSARSGERESLMIGPEHESSVEKAVLAAAFGHRSTGPDSSCDRPKETPGLGG